MNEERRCEMSELMTRENGEEIARARREQA